MKGPKDKTPRKDAPNASPPSDTPPPFSPNDISHCGWLFSRNQHKSRFKRNWQQDWFMIVDGEMHHFKHQGSISLSGCKMKSRNSNISDHEPSGYVLEVHQSEETPSSKQSKKSSQKPLLLSTLTQSEIDKWEREIRKVRGGVFGASLEDTIMNESENETKEIPAVVELCVSYLRENALREEGIFRLNGRTGTVQELQDAIDAGEEMPDFNKIDVGVHTVASLLKRYFQLLPEPIIPWRHCKYFIPVMQALKQNDDDGCRQLILQLALLPRVNYNLLKYLCEFLHEVHKYENQNKMGLGNLANIFAPHILRPQNAQGAYLLGSTALSLQLVHYLIRNEKKVFPPMNSINTSPPTRMRNRNNTARIYRKGTNEYKCDKIERRTDESRARSKSRTNRRSGRVDWCASTEIIDGECVDTMKVEVHSVYENMDVSNGLSLIESIKSRISESSSKLKTHGAHKVKRYGVSYKDPSSILSPSTLGQRCYSAPGNEDDLLRGKTDTSQNGDVNGKMKKIQSAYQNVELGPSILETITTSMKDHVFSASNSSNKNAHQKKNPQCTLNDNSNTYINSDVHYQENGKYSPYQNGEDSGSDYDNQDTPVHKKHYPSSTAVSIPPKNDNNLYQNPLPFPMTLPDELLLELKHHNSTNHSLIPKPANQEYASSDIIHSNSNTLPLAKNPGFTCNGKLTMNGKVSYNSGDVSGHMQALRVKLRQKDEEVSKQFRHVELIKRDYEMLKIRLGAEESARVMIEEHNRQLTSEVHLLQKRLGLVH